jgi:6-phosphogluconate dehydrogenase (decarboxylating)
MIHNGIEYGVMAAYAEGLEFYRSANIGKQTGEAPDAETTRCAIRRSISTTSNLPISRNSGAAAA